MCVCVCVCVLCVCICACVCAWWVNQCVSTRSSVAAPVAAPRWYAPRLVLCEIKLVNVCVCVACANLCVRVCVRVCVRARTHRFFSKMDVNQDAHAHLGCQRT